MDDSISTYTVRVNLGGNYELEFITSSTAPWANKLPRDLVAVLFDNAPNGAMVLIEGKTISEATENAKKFLKHSRNLENLLAEIERHDG